MSDPGNRFGRLFSWDAAVVLVTVVVVLVASGAVENFGTSRNFTFLLLDLLPIALIALPMTFIIVTGEIDLSVASTPSGGEPAGVCVRGGWFRCGRGSCRSRRSPRSASRWARCSARSTA